MITAIIISILAIAIAIGWFYIHQQRLTDRAHLMREAMRAHDFSFHLPVHGMFFGERALQETLNDLGKEISRLVAQNEVESWQKLTRVLTHEIMNATTPISSISQAFLSRPDINGSVYEEGIRAIHDTSVGLTSFVENYRKLTQLQPPVLIDVSLKESIDVVKSLYPTINWHIDIPDTAIIRTDENLLRQVFINITKNAIEAGASEIDIRLTDNLLCFSNNGKPIPAEVAREIFIPFFTTKKTGTGIGLSLSRHILITQGGNLALAEHPVNGYHVTFLLEFDTKG